jgi:hypothetical protein
VINFYLNHIGVTIFPNGEEVFWSGRVQDKLPDYRCGSYWSGWRNPFENQELELEFRLHNMHEYGNANAYNEFLESFHYGIELPKNIIQESKTLTVDDFVKIINAIYKSGIVDKTVKRSVVASAILNNPMQLFQLLKSDSVENAIVVNFNPDKLKTKKLSSYTELSKEKILEKMEQDKVLGIKRGLTEKNDNLPDVKKLAMEI